jgi:hypothetical protein
MKDARGRFAWTLIWLEAMLSAAAFGGAVYFFLLPHDAMPTDILARTPFDTWVWPGVLLAAVVGVPSGAVAAGAAVRKPWAHIGHPIVGLMLMGWIAVQIGIVGFIAALQPLMFAWGVAIALLGAINYRRWHCAWGATDSEEHAGLPGDDLIARPHFAPTRAITIPAPPERVWPWIVQLGYGQAGWYSYDWLDNAGRPSAEAILPAFQQPATGTFVPMSKRTGFRVRKVEAPHMLLWVKPDATWVWRLNRTASGGTRLVTRVRARYTGWSAFIGVPLMELGDFPMMRKCLLGIRLRATAGSMVR